MIAYRMVQSLLRGAVHVFFRQVHLVGLEHIPPPGEGPVIFAGNHPNSLIDPVLIVTTCGRTVHFAAKDKLFRQPLKPFLNSLGCVPIARKSDHGEGARDNNQALAALTAVLGEGRCMGIFPEGLSHHGSSIQRLRTGCARIALETARSHPSQPICVVPVGLTYMHRKRFRSRVLVQYGTPLFIGPDRVEQFEQDSRMAALQLTSDVEDGIRALTVNAPDWQTLRVLDGVRRLYQPRGIPLRDRVELARRFCQVYPTVSERPEVMRLMGKVEAYLERLDDAGLTDADLLAKTSAGELSRRSVRQLLDALMWLPLAIPTAPLHAPLLALVGWAGLRFAPRKDVIGTTRLVLGLFAVLLVYATAPLVVWGWLGLQYALVVALSLPVSGYATVRLLERGTSLRRLAIRAWRALTLRDTLNELRAQRGQLQGLIVDAVAQLVPDDMTPLYPDRGREG